MTYCRLPLPLPLDACLDNKNNLLVYVCCSHLTEEVLSSILSPLLPPLRNNLQRKDTKTKVCGAKRQRCTKTNMEAPVDSLVLGKLRR